MTSILIKDTTSMERIQIVKDSLEGEYDEFYDDYAAATPQTTSHFAMKRIFLLISIAFACLCGACSQPDCQYPFQNPGLSPEKRAENLLSLLTTEEKLTLLTSTQSAVERLGIPTFQWGSEACHGIRQEGATVFPQSIGMAATFDKDLVYPRFKHETQSGRRI